MKPRLAGMEILVTRPSGQSAELARLIRDAGGKPVLFPALEIEPLPDAALAPVFDHLGSFDLVIFASPNAARVAMPLLLERGGLPAHAKVAALGPGTAAELKKNGLRNIIAPREGFDSEALLGELASVPLQDTRILMVRGLGGREFLGDVLRSRGAAIEHLECYRRVKPDRDMSELLPQPGRDGVKACLATSASVVENLFEMAGAAGRHWLCSVPFFVSHPRVAASAFSAGMRTVFVAGNGDDALVSGLETWFARLRPPGAD